MEPIKVAFLTPTLLFGGAERWVVSLASALNPTRFNVFAIAIRDAHATDNTILQRVPTDTTVLHGSHYFADLAHAADIIIAWGLDNLQALATRRAKVVLVSHGACPWTCNCLRHALRYADFHAAVSRSAAQVFPNPNAVTILHNGIDVDRCTPNQSRELQRTLWGANPDDKLIGYVGRLSDEKNPLAAVYTATMLGPPYRPLLIGGGPHAPAYVAQARAINRRTISYPVVENVGNVYHALDLFMLVSKFEGFSLALTEAWYCRCPTLSTRVGAIELEELHGKLGVTIPPAHTPRDLVTATLAALAPQNRPTIERAHQVVAHAYTARHMARRWEQYLEHVAATTSHQCDESAIAR